MNEARRDETSGAMKSSDEIRIHTFPNGLTLLAEPMPHVRSAAFTLAVSAGSAHDPTRKLGIANVLSELVSRGAGSRSSEEIVNALDNLGLDHGESVGLYNVRFRGVGLGVNLLAALEIYADILRRPHLDAEELEPVRALALQDLRGLEDDPPSRLFVELYRYTYPAPLGTDHRGTEETLAGLTIDDVRTHFQQTYRPHGAILAVAGDVQWDALLDGVGRLLGDWQGRFDSDLSLTPTPGNRVHLTRDVEETQIGLSCPAVPFGHPDYYAAQGAVGVLSGGMSSRLFTEIREKEGLCYSVSASYQSLKDRAVVMAYAGSVNEKAQRTLDLLLRELGKLHEGVTPDEVERVIVTLKTSQIFQQESTTARAGSLLSDWYYLGRVRSFEEIRAAIEGLTPEKICAYCERYPLRDFVIATLGPQPLNLPI